MAELDNSASETRLQYPSHTEFIARINSSARANVRPDAIVVPAARPAMNLLAAIELASAADCRLVVLCSKDTKPREAHSFFAARGFGKGIAVHVPPDYTLPHLSLETTDWVKQGPGKSVCGGRESDLSTKRNLSLLLARMLGWHRIFFLDDDIRGITAADLSSTVSLLSGEFRSAGMQVNNFRDNSVVCHARHKASEYQDVFLSGSMLAVDCNAPFAFFPDIYNEDWLFFYQDVAARRMATPGLGAERMEQLGYNPFADPQRAVQEEFGDVFAEGIYSLLHRGLGLEHATADYWKRFIADRMKILDEIITRANLVPAEIRTQMIDSILAARNTLADILPSMCVDYLDAWQLDLIRWENRLTDLPVGSSVEDALRQLGLHSL